MQITQQLASQIVQAVLVNGQNLTDTLSATFKNRPTLTVQQRGAIQDISYGTLRFYGTINSVLRLLSHKPITDEAIAYLVLITLYQLIYTRAKTHAVVDSAVTNARCLKAPTAGLVNAILRNFLRQQDTLLMKAKETEIGQYSHPQWWIDRIKSAHLTTWQALLLANNEHPLFTLRVNRRKTTLEAYLHLLNEANIAAQALDEWAILLENPISVDKLPHFYEGHVSIQDWGAQQAAPLLDAQPGMRILDACAAPGGKTCHLLEMTDVEVLALDKDPKRLARIQSNLDRLQLTARLQCADAVEIASWWDGQLFDRILADVPCSATGVVRRHPDIKWLRRPQDIAKFAKQQRQILDALWGCLKTQGKLLYVTCAIFPEENEAQAQAFLQQHPNAKRVPLPDNGQWLPTQKHDGFYYALFEKI
jgi:16S rRNA (cytosine967-C5)-methyltransferase